MLLQADARAIPLADRSVQCVVTSPPYWGLRDYGIAGQLGAETTPAAYVAALVAVFQQVRRVLRDDGVLFLNLGDSYAAGKTGRDDNSAADRARLDAFGHGGGVKLQATGNTGRARPVPAGLKPKDLVGIPWRVAFALQADGWYLRSDIIWAKPNPMPESVTDRPTKSHEYVFLLTKAERYAWYPDAVREPSTMTPQLRLTARADHPKGDAGRPPHRRPEGGTGYADRNLRSVWTIATQPYAGAHFATMPEALARRCVLAATQTGDRVLDPFAGSGTVPRCAISLGRRGIGMDLSPAYLDLATERITVTRGLPFDEISA